MQGLSLIINLEEQDKLEMDRIVEGGLVKIQYNTTLDTVSVARQ